MPRNRSRGVPPLTNLIHLHEHQAVQLRASGGIGRRAAFRSLYPKGCRGSTPLSRTRQGPGDPGAFVVSGGCRGAREAQKAAMVPSALARCHAARARSWKETTLSDAREVAAQPRVTPVRENLYTLYKKYR